MVVGEAQILGQLRDAYHAATERDAAGRLLHELMQQALRVGKRAHAETGIDRAGQSVVTAALDLAAGRSTATSPAAPALVVGAGAMGALAVATLTRPGVGPLTSPTAAPTGPPRLAELVRRRPRSDCAELADTLSDVDVVVCATASTEPVLTATVVAAALAGATPAGPLVVLDLAVPRDVDAGGRRAARRRR